jgi:hypothetical protein
MRRVLRLALALSVLVALSAPGAVRAQSRDEDPGVPQVTLEFEDDYEDTRATGHAAYDEMDAAAMVRAPVFRAHRPARRGRRPRRAASRRTTRSRGRC